MRKVIIGLVAVGAVAAAFLCYVLIMDSGTIKAPETSSGKDLNMPAPVKNVQRTGNADLRGAEKAQYVILNPETKEISRVLGFSKLLNPGAETSRWLVEEPYIVFYDTKYECRVDSDTGTFQVDSASSNASPKDAQLTGNVTIQIKPRDEGRLSETLITMDDLAFSSERSEFATDGKVRIESDQMQLDGFGLILIFNTASGRIDYLHIRDLIELRIFDMADVSSVSQKQAQGQDSVSASKLISSEDAPVEDSSDKQALAVSAIETGDVSKQDYYHCAFKDNVTIQYGDELVVSAADQIDIQNIEFSGIEQSSSEKAPALAAKESEKKKTARIKHDIVSQRSHKSTSKTNAKKDIVVKCRGGIILRPMYSEFVGSASFSDRELCVKQPENAFSEIQTYRNKKRPAIQVVKPTISYANNNMIHIENNVEFTTAAGILASSDTMGSDSADQVQPQRIHTYDDPVIEKTSDSATVNAAQFEAKQIDYDLITGSGLAHGPVSFTFYQPSDSIKSTLVVPVTITSDMNAQFLAGQDHRIEQVVFNQNVLATRRSEQANVVQLDTFHGDILTISLDNKIEAGTDVRSIRMANGNVYAESKRMREEQILSHVKLYCEEMYFSKTDNTISAFGPGKIEMDNSHTEASGQLPADSEFDLRRPCFVYCEGFNLIRWDLNRQTIVSEGRHDVMRVVYIPLKQGVPEKFIHVNSSQFDVGFDTDIEGKTVLKRIFTDQGIVYKEENADRSKTLHMIVGQTLEYDQEGTDGWIRIVGTPAVPVNVDRSRLKEVFVNPQTGEMEASLSRMPGLFKR